MSNLDFLNRFINNSNEKYTKPSFLKNDFYDAIWTVEYSNKDSSTIDFNIYLANGSLLTDKSNELILNTLKYWITHSIIENSFQMKSKSMMRNLIFSIISIFDFFNLNSKTTYLNKYGFKMLTNDFLKYTLNTFASSNDKFEGVYGSKTRVIKAFYKSVKNVDLPTSILKDEDKSEFLLYINSVDFKIADLYPDTILKPRFIPDFGINEYKKIRNIREYSNIFDENLDDNKHRSKLSYILFKKAILSLKSLCNANINQDLLLPAKSIFEDLYSFNPQIKSDGRYKTVPSDVIFKILSNAIEFHYKYGNLIVNTYVETMIEYRCSKTNLEDILIKKLPVELFNIGVRKLKPVSLNYENRFTELRNHLYFYDLLKSYYGAVQIVIGILMARRQSELCSLVSGECLDKVNNQLIFKQSKSTKNVFGKKNTLYLPIDNLGIEMIENLEKINSVSYTKMPLFSMPSFKDISKFNKTLDNTTYSENIDHFIDYINLEPVNGKRHYVRQHQFRRFFAMTFFWGSGFGSLDTLRWFMGHTDVEHVYRYITESVSGEVLNSIKTEYIVANIRKYEDIINLLKEKYHTENFDLIDSDDLNSYIEDLLDDNKIIVEPEFIKSDNGTEYNILVKVIGE